MKTLTALFVLISLLFSPALASHAQPPKAEVETDEFLIRQAVEDLYIRGLEVRDFGLIREVCVPETKLMSAGRDGELRVTALDTWSKRFDPANPPFESLESAVVKIDRVGTAAQVKILFIVNDDRRVTDYLHMLKLDGRWRIVHIIDY